MKHIDLPQLYGVLKAEPKRRSTGAIYSSGNDVGQPLDRMSSTVRP